MDITLDLDGVAWSAECKEIGVKATGKSAHGAVYGLAKLIEQRAEGEPTPQDVLDEIRGLTEGPTRLSPSQIADKLREILGRES